MQQPTAEEFQLQQRQASQARRFSLGMMSPGAFATSNQRSALYFVAEPPKETTELKLPHWWLDYRRRLEEKIGVKKEDSAGANTEAKAGSDNQSRTNGEYKSSVVRKMMRSASTADLAAEMAASMTEGLCLDIKWSKVSEHFAGATGLRLAAKLEVYSKTTTGEEREGWERDEEQASNWPLRGKNHLKEIRMRDRSR